MESLWDVLHAQGTDLSHWNELIGAFGISDDGRSIVGYGQTTSGQTEAFLARINSVPEPSSIFAWVVFGVVFASRRTRKKSTAE